MPYSIKQLITDNLEEALKILQKYADRYQENDVLMQTARLNRLNKEKQRGVLNSSHETIERNKITQAAFSLAEEINVPQDVLDGLDATINPTPISLTNPTPVPQNNPSQSTNPKIFFSYAWGDDREQGESREEIVNQLYESLSNKGYNLVRDKVDLGYRGYISEFMRDIGEGEMVIVVLSEKYVKSPFCMFELYEIARNSRLDKQAFRERVFPVMVEFVNFNDPTVRGEYLDYWDQESQKWEDLIRKNPGSVGSAGFERYDKIRKVRQNFGDLVDWLIDMNALSPKLLASNDFATVRQAIDEKLGELGGVSVSSPSVDHQTPPSTTAGSMGSLSSTTQYNTSNIRAFFLNAMDSTDFDSFCMDNYVEVHRQFGSGMNQSQKINLLIEYCSKYLRIDELLRKMQRENARRYERHKPYRK